MALLPKYLFDDNVIRPRSSFTKVYGLNFIINKRSSVFDKKFGAPGIKHWSTPRIRRLERPAHSKRKRIAIVQQFNDCLLLGKMRAIVENFYFFGSELQKKNALFIARKQASGTYQSLRTLIGLPCKGQRSKTNARTCKRLRVLSTDIEKLLTRLSVQQSKAKMFYAKKLASSRDETQKTRVLRDLMQQKRYRPTAKTLDVDKHYEDVYNKIISTKRKKKNRSI
jgi:ribosomal protein S13